MHLKHDSKLLGGRPTERGVGGSTRFQKYFFGSFQFFRAVFVVLCPFGRLQVVKCLQKCYTSGKIIGSFKCCQIVNKSHPLSHWLCFKIQFKRNSWKIPTLETGTTHWLLFWKNGHLPIGQKWANFNFWMFLIKNQNIARVTSIFLYLLSALRPTAHPGTNFLSIFFEFS